MTDNIETNIDAISAHELEKLYRQPASTGEYSPLNGHPMVLLDLLKVENPATPQQLGALEKILPQLPCPLIAIAESGDNNPLINAADVRLSSYKEAKTLIRNIQQHPLTAMTLVQLLRHNERSNLNDALLAESLAFATLQAGQEFKNYLTNRTEPPIPAANPAPAVIFDRDDNNLTLTLNRPKQRNAYSTEVRDALFEGLQLVAEDSSITKTFIAGAGSCFCTGGALHEFGLMEDATTAHAIRCSRHVGQLIAALSDKVECHLHKACIGSGIELPAFAHRIVATADSFFQLPEITMGLIPGAGGTASILRRIGRQRTAWLMLSAKRINAKTALEWGLIDEIK